MPETSDIRCTDCGGMLTTNPDYGDDLSAELCSDCKHRMDGRSFCGCDEVFCTGHMSETKSYDEEPTP